MRITASQIVEWASAHAKVAQQELPRLVRRLCFDCETTSQIAFPAGDSTFVPGWDGSLTTDEGNAWVPVGTSRWEMGCDQKITSKANGDYDKRTTETEEGIRSTLVFVFVSPRRWTQKTKWIAAKRAEEAWLDVRAYDADDLEQWLEQSPIIALQFAEELGLSGEGVESPNRYWVNWAHQCSPPISAEAFVGDRAQVQNEIQTSMMQALSQEGHMQPMVVCADSIEEAVAFSVVVALESLAVSDKVLVVTDPGGWRFVEMNPQIKIVIASNQDVASKLIVRDGLQVVTPCAFGDMTANDSFTPVTLERPAIYKFEEALVVIGVEKSDAARIAANAGRSWTVFRRQHAVNQAIQSPPWVEQEQSEILSLLCLINAWDDSNTNDREIVERIAQRPYDEVERDLRVLVVQDDSPVLQLGSVWKVKSALEVLSMVGGRITSAQLDRFFEVAMELLAAPDPQLELPESERWLASIHGKVRSDSKLLFESVCDSLMKLAVRGSELPGLKSLHLDSRVSHFISELLQNADGVRWLSLASRLPILAEAAPDSFLRAVEGSLASDEKAVIRLLTETGDSGLTGGRCWHAGLLWALERLAWSPRLLSRIILILARLTHIEIKGNWGNTPNESLLGIFRSWLPQTAAVLKTRIQALDLLIEREPEASFRLLEGLLQDGPQYASNADRPDWRDDDAGVGHGVSDGESYQMVVAAKERLLTLAEGDASKIASILQNTLFKHHDGVGSVLPFIQPYIFSGNNDEERETIRDALRGIIHWHRNYDDSDESEIDLWLKPVESCYEGLVPHDTVIRHRWLFANHSVELPAWNRDKGIQERDNVLVAARRAAVNEIYAEKGMDGIDELIAVSGDPEAIGRMLAVLLWKEVSWVEWTAERGEGFHSGPVRWCLSGFFHALPDDQELALLKELRSIAKSQKWENKKYACLLALAKTSQHVWNFVEQCNNEIVVQYWGVVVLSSWREEEDVAFVMQKLVDAKRPLTALRYCEFSLEKVPEKLLYAALQQLLLGEESNGPKFDSWHLDKVLEHLEKSNEIEKMELAQLEFRLYPALRHGFEERANLLFEMVISEPEIFNELLCLAFKSEHESPRELTDGEKSAGTTAWRIFRDCKVIPGAQKDGAIDEGVMVAFIEAVCEQAEKDDRRAVCEIVLGEILAYCPTIKDVLWPLESVSRVLDRPEYADMRRGFRTGVFNKRGVTTRSPYDGGGQERKLAAYYRQQSEGWQFTYPNVSAILGAIADGYDGHGEREDDEAGLRREGF